MLRQLPRWAWVGGGLLALGAGCINVVGYLCFRHQPITHLTGTSTEFGLALARGDAGEIAHWGLVILAFLLGAMLSGFIVQQGALRLGRRYGVVLMLESALLFAATPLIHGGHDLGLYLASAACGLQNAMVSTYSGATVRTTHLSGIFTDLGIYLGHRLRGLEVDSLRINICLLVASHFIVGATLGALGFMLWQERVLLAPATLTGVVGLGYAIYRHRHFD
ncbi:YoaK family protein [Dyella japonica]|uniref:Membrane protein n=1 Tax=Dyella japonica DSM 16301 TaxID=1440762 RepID=A0A0G9H2V3_9GAMM|nr:YoaK family protein [Dyella japonica]KLD63893.1 membrane protein [Dyella japonica DSM 16301]